jgi:predicted anti-sigma-YlaC factor YlaD
MMLSNKDERSEQVKRHSHIRSLLLPWVELTLNEDQRQFVEEHLKECGFCRQYFDIMSRALLPSPDYSQDTLLPDPYLPTRVKAMASLSGAEARRGKNGVALWTMRSAMFVIAVVFGIYLGERLAYQPSTVTEQNLIAEYSESFEAGGIADRMQSVAQINGEDLR